MSGPGASPGEMPGFSFSHRPGGALDESLLDALLNGQPLPPDAPEHAQGLAEMLASLAGPGELAGEAAARFAFAKGASPVGISPVVRRSARWTPSWLPASFSARLAAGLVAVAVGLGGAAAAYAGALPGPVQDLAHHVLHAPPPHSASHPKPQPAEQKPHARSQPAKPGKENGPGNAKGHASAKAKGHAKPNGHASAKANGKAKAHAKPAHRPKP